MALQAQEANEQVTLRAVCELLIDVGGAVGIGEGKKKIGVSVIRLKGAGRSC